MVRQNLFWKTNSARDGLSLNVILKQLLCLYSSKVHTTKIYLFPLRVGCGIGPIVCLPPLEMPLELQVRDVEELSGVLQGLFLL